MKYKITKQDNKYYIRNAETDQVLKTEYDSFEEARSVLEVRPEVRNLCYTLDKDLIDKLKPLYRVNREFNYYGD